MMNGFNLFLKLSSITFLLGSLLLFVPVQSSYAVSGCCSGHGGVDKCDTTIGYQICKDGTQSTCVCKKTKETLGCCSGHGGVASCDIATGYQICKDGTKSPTCKCKK